jgi:hypothetical protein
VRNYSEQGDIIGYKPGSDFCKKHKDIFLYLFNILKKDDKEINKVLWSWINRKPINIEENCI